MKDKRGFFYQTADRWLLPIVRSRSQALLLIKPPLSTGPLRIDESPTELLDLPRTMLETVGISGTSTAGMNVLVDSIPLDRSRSFYTYDFPHVRKMREYRVQEGRFEEGEVSEVRR